MSARTTLRARRGMTIIEVMLSIVILLIMSIVGWASLDGAIDLNDALSRTDETTRTARVALTRMRKQITLAYLRRDAATNPLLQNSFQTVLVGENRDPDRIWFTSLGHKRLYRDSRESDQTEITLWVERSPNELEPGDILYLREAPRIDEEPDREGRILPLAYHVENFELRYLNGRTNEWVDEWDTRSAETPGQLPRAVQIGLVLLAPDADNPRRSVQMPFVTTALLEYADPVVAAAGRNIPDDRVPEDE